MATAELSKAHEDANKKLSQQQRYQNYLSGFANGAGADQSTSQYQQMMAFQKANDDVKKQEEEFLKAQNGGQNPTGTPQVGTAPGLQAGSAASTSTNPNAAKSAVGAPYSSGNFKYNYSNPTKETFDSAAYLAANPEIQQHLAKEGVDAWYHYQTFGMKEGRKLQAVDPETAKKYEGAIDFTRGINLITGEPLTDKEMDIVKAGGQLAVNPGALINGDMSLKGQVPLIDPNTPGTEINPNDPRYQQANGPNAGLAQGTATTVGSVQQRPTNTYQALQTYDKVAANDMTGATGIVGENSLIDPNKITIDTDKTAAGQNALGQALNQSAQQNISNLIDTSTLAGKMLAQQLGEGNYTDTKATIQGQLEMLSAQFVDADGNPKIPSWAAGTARNVSKIASFSGVTGTAATAAMAQAIMEASIPMASADAAFFQTTTLKNLDNRQQATINRAQVLANLELANMDARTTAAVNNANAFLQTDLKNLDNEQQARVINQQSRVQAIMEDAKAVNTERLFTAQSQNEMNMFYDNLNSSVQQFNASQLNAMSQFNASESNAQSRFNAELENQRQEFYKTMQYNIDVSNTKWRQTVTLSNTQMQFDAAATDVRNLVGLSMEQLNQLWDRSDSVLQQTWQTAENALDRSHQLLAMAQQHEYDMKALKEKAKLEKKASGGIGGILGSIGGKLLGSIAGPIGSAIGGKIGGSLFS